MVGYRRGPRTNNKDIKEGLILKKSDISLFNTILLPEMENIAIEVLRSGKIANGKYIEKLEEVETLKIAWRSCNM